MTLHDLFTLLNLPIGTLGHDMTQPLPEINIGVQYIRYISEYIPNLQLHQHPAPLPSAYQCSDAFFPDIIIPRGYSLHEVPTLVMVPLQCECVWKEV